MPRRQECSAYGEATCPPAAPARDAGHRNRCGDLILHPEHVGQLPVVALRPEMATTAAVTSCAVTRIRLPNCARSPPGHRRRRACQQSFERPCARLERERRRAGDDLQAADFHQRIDDVVGEPFAEVLLVPGPRSGSRTGGRRSTELVCGSLADASVASLTSRMVANRPDADLHRHPSGRSPPPAARRRVAAHPAARWKSFRRSTLRETPGDR